jgi:hypothetical protein
LVLGGVLEAEEAVVEEVVVEEVVAAAVHTAIQPKSVYTP